MKFQHLNEQWQTMIESGRIPVLEYQVSEDDWLLVDVSLIEGEGLLFSFDKEIAFDTHFSGEVEKVLNHYQVNFDEYFDNLDHYLQLIDSEMTEGYLLPNGLYYTDY